MVKDIKPSDAMAPDLPDCQTGKASSVTYSNQARLPILPIPELEDTCKKYLETLKPLQTARENEASAAAVQNFLHLEGPDLQRKLKNFLLEDDPTPARNNQVTRAASLIISALSFVRALRKEDLPPDTIRGTPLCMYQYSRIFATARVPTERGCRIVQDPNSKHIVVMCRGQFYWFDVLDNDADLITNEKDVAANLDSIVEDAAKTSIHDAAKGALGVLTTESRKVWSRLRDILTQEEGSNNADCLGIVDSALFILCLDYTSPSNGADLCKNMLCGTNDVEKGVQIGTCTNRWYDKLQIIVCQNGSAGINFEHTSVDGHTVLRMVSDVYTDTILRFARTINGQAPSLWASTSPDPSKRDPSSFGDVTLTPRKLEWNMDPALSIALRFAETRLADLIQQNESQTLDFAGYGSNFIKSMAMSPDAFIQMALQAAYYGLYGRVECTYEPAMTKAFLHGRTEAIRTVTLESLNYVKTFWGDNPPELKVDALRKACQKHSNITKECGKARGQDRHLYALYCVWQHAADEASASLKLNAQDPAFPNTGDSSTQLGTHDKEKARRATLQHSPAIFVDGGWDKINSTILSTSNCGNPSLRHFGFGPTSADGFGLGYIIKENGISICATSKHRQTKRFVDAIESYFLEVAKLFRLTQRLDSSKASRTREIEGHRPSIGTRIKSCGRAITTGISVLPQKAENKSKGELDDDGLGGYGFFDSGMLGLR
ncbi:MAG: hypothetical protein M1829_002454 [Trizodia sp. TS-e1964]|nr:MAG: hypothetical protein M1829_002454 [Trizodia sp. TS-e1964]